MQKSLWRLIWILNIFLSFNCLADDNADLTELNLNSRQFVISFPANPSTGYLWTIVSYDENRFHLIRSEYMTPNKINRIGAPGKMIYEFEVREAGTYPFSSKIKFRYARSWDKNSGIEKTAVITVRKSQQRPSVEIQ